MRVDLALSAPGGIVQVQRLVGEAYGRRFAIEAPEPFLSALRPDLPYGWHETHADAERTWRVVTQDDGAIQAFLGATPVTSTGSVTDVVRQLAQDVELWVAETAERLVFVHAGVVAVDGCAIVIPGPSRAGKSTLVAALVRAGAEYLSDEFAPLDAHGLVHAYRRAPSQRPDSPAAAWPLPHLPTAQTPPMPVALVASVRWEQGAEPRLTPVSHAAGIMPLLSNTVCALTRSEEALDVLSVATRDALRVEGVRGDAAVMAADLLGLLVRRAASA